MSIARECYVRYRQLIHEAAKFGVVGVIGFVVSDGGTNLLRGLRSMDWLAANAIATIAAIAVTFVGSRYWTFRHRERTGAGRETAVFFGLAAIGLLIQLACLAFTTHVIGETGRLAANVALIIGIVLGTLFRFWSYRKWVWRAPVADLIERQVIDAAEVSGGGAALDQAQKTTLSHCLGVMSSRRPRMTANLSVREGECRLLRAAVDWRPCATERPRLFRRGHRRPGGWNPRVARRHRPGPAPLYEQAKAHPLRAA